MQNKRLYGTEHLHDWNITSNNKVSGVLSNELYLGLMKRPTAKKILKKIQVEKYISMNQDFVNSFFYDFLYKNEMRMACITTPPGCGKSTFIYELGFKNPHVYSLILEPTRAICNQINQNPHYKKTIRVISSQVNNRVNMECHKYLCTAELAQKIANNILAIDKEAIILLFVDEAHELTQSNAEFRQEGLQQVYEAIQTVLHNNGRIVMLSATPENMYDIDFDIFYDIKPQDQINSGSLTVFTIDKKAEKVTYVKAYTKVLKEYKRMCGRPVFCHFDNLKKIFQMKAQLEKDGYVVAVAYGNTKEALDSATPTTAQQNAVLQYVAKNQTLPATTICDDGCERAIDFLLTTSAILSGVNIHENPNLGKNQYVPVMIIDKADKFCVSNIIQFFTRLRYDVPCSAFIKHIFNKKVNLNAASADRLKKVLSNILNEHVKGSVANAGYYNNEAISTLNSFVEDGESFVKNLTAFNHTKHHLEIDEFATAYCAWFNYNIRLYIDAPQNQNALETALRSHLHVTNYENIIYPIIDTKETLKQDNAETQTDAQNPGMTINKAELVNQFLLIKDCLDKLDECATNDIINLFKDRFRRYMPKIRTLRALSNEDTVKKYISLLGVSQKEAASVFYKEVAESMNKQVDVYGFQHNLLSITMNYMNVPRNQMNLTEDVKNKVIALRNCVSFKKAAEQVQNGVPAEQVINTAIQAASAYEMEIAFHAKALVQAYCDGIDIAKVNLMGAEIACILEQLVHLNKERNQFISTLGADPVINDKVFDGFARLLQDKIDYTHKKKYTAYTIKRILKTIFVTSEMSDGLHLLFEFEYNAA